MQRLTEHDEAVLDAIFDPLQLISDANRISSDELVGDPNDEKVLELVKTGIETAEAGRIDEALRIFDEARERAPDDASILNDRAQALRLAGRISDALENLNEALRMTNSRGKVAGKALCQRGLLHRLAGREDQAKQDFQEAAKNGSTFARTQLVHLNPYAAMCNAMLKEINSKS
ncbi:tetratricopeptide repeat protein 36 isoform X2 [Diachasma alloeum]|uniref:tetratricopeptide repeat protein 36 isoform X2 n=1 Tax=Diachasma alloeum TaxID=454923 RepID=UPI0007383802|nr:tetratricopeptide repeat protein 36 isoform X2 [Diachasma alloeum]